MGGQLQKSASYLMALSELTFINFGEKDHPVQLNSTQKEQLEPTRKRLHFIRL